MASKLKLLSALIVSAGLSAAASATVVSQTFTSGDNGGIVTFTDSDDDASLGSNQLKITFDNTTTATNVGPGPYLNSSVITGVIFNILADINSVTSFTFTDGNGTDLTSMWQVALNIDSNISDGNTVFDVTFDTTNGINGGIYNAASPGTDLNNVFPDIATLILTIGDPDPYSLASVGDDSVLRMQRVGAGGEGSLKIPTTTTSSTTSTTSSGASGTAPEPGTLSLLGGAILGGLFHYRRRQQIRA